MSKFSNRHEILLQSQFDAVELIFAISCWKFITFKKKSPCFHFIRVLKKSFSNLKIDNLRTSSPTQLKLKLLDFSHFSELEKKIANLMPSVVWS